MQPEGGLRSVRLALLLVTSAWPLTFACTSVNVALAETGPDRGGARRCVTRSATLLRVRWGEGVAGTLGISALTGVVAIVLGAALAVIPFAPRRRRAAARLRPRRVRTPW